MMKEAIDKLVELAKSINWRCELCGSEHKLVNHHINYIPESVIVVCSGCHGQIHKSESLLCPEMSRTEFLLIQRILASPYLEKYPSPFKGLNLFDIFKDPSLIRDKLPTDAEMKQIASEKNWATTTRELNHK